MLRKTRLILCGAALLIALCTLCTAVVYEFGAMDPRNADVTAAPQQKTMALSGRESVKPLYIVKEYEGQVCVFLPDGTIPELMTGIPASTLRSGDQLLLKEGIRVDSQEALASILEDFGY